MKVKYGQNTIIDDDEKTSVTLRTQKKMLDYDLQIQASGGEGEFEPDVEFVDYDATVLYSYSAQDFLSLNALPENPSHEGLTSLGWNWSLEDAKEYVQDTGAYLCIGQLYEEQRTYPSSIKYIDLSGNILYEYTLSEFLGLSEPPTVPTRPGCISEGWNWSLNDAKEYAQIYKRLIIGPQYSTENDDNRIHINLTYGKYSVKLKMRLKGTASIDWGDESALETVTYSSMSNINKTHAYQSPGHYIIIVHPEDSSTTFDLGVGAATATNYHNNIIESFSNNSQQTALTSTFIEKLELGKQTDINFTAALANLSNMEELVLSPGASRTTINSQCFVRNYNLKAVIIPNSYTSYSGASTYLFDANYNILYISFPKVFQISGQYNYGFITNTPRLKEFCYPPGLTAARAITQAYGLEYLILPNSVTSFGGATGCRALKRLYMPSSITSIGSLSSLNSLEHLFIPSNLTAFSSFSDCRRIKTVFFPSTFSNTIPSASQNTSLECVSLSKNAQGVSSFSYCYSLKKISFNKRITSFNQTETFYYNRSLESIRVPSNVTYFASNLFQYCTGLKKAIAPGVTQTTNNTFIYCYSLEEVTLSSQLSSTGSSIFQSTSIKEFTFPSTLTTLQTQLFMDCQSLKKVVLPQGVTSIPSSFCSSCYGLISINIPSSVTSINSSAFQSCWSLNDINIPSSVTLIGSNAFYNCTSLTEVDLSGVTNIGSYAFYSCSSLQSVELSHALTTIGDYAFQYCSSIASLAIPDTLTSLGQHVFDGCNALYSLHIPHVAQLKQYGVYNLLNLKELYVDATTLKNASIYNCLTLRKITIGEHVTTCESNAFSTSQTSLQELIIEAGNTCTIANNFIPSTPAAAISTLKFTSQIPPVWSSSSSISLSSSVVTIYVPRGSLEAYTTATNYPSASTYTYVEYDPE